MVFQFAYFLAVMSMTYYHGEDPGHVNLYISGYEDTEIRITYPWSNGARTVTLNSENHYRWNLTRRLSASDRDLAATQGIRVTSTKQVSIQVARGKIQMSNVAAYTAIHLTRNSTEHYLSARANSPRGLRQAHPLFIVGAWDQPAIVSVYRSKGVASSLVVTETLTPYQMKEFPASTADGNLTGYYVTSDQPVVVYSGHQCGNVPNNVLYCEPILQQIAPVSRVGRKYVTGPLMFRSRTGYTVRVVFTRDNSQLAYAGKPNSVSLVNVGAAHKCTDGEGGLDLLSTMPCTSALLAGDYLEFQMSNASWPMMISCSKDCYTYQFNHGGTQYDAGQVKTDPFMMMLQPLDLLETNQAQFSTISSYSRGNPFEFRNFVNIVIPTGQSMLVDGATLSSDEVGLSVQDWQVYTIEVTHGFHKVSTTNPRSVLAVQVYGHGPRTGFSGQSGYGFPAAYAVQYSNDLESVEKPTTRTTVMMTHKQTPTTTTSTPTTTTPTQVTAAPTKKNLGDGHVKSEKDVDCKPREDFSVWLLIAMVTIGILVIVIICLATALVIVSRKKQTSIYTSGKSNVPHNSPYGTTKGEQNSGYTSMYYVDGKCDNSTFPIGSKHETFKAATITDRSTYDDVVVPKTTVGDNTGVYDYINDV